MMEQNDEQLDLETEIEILKSDLETRVLSFVSIQKKADKALSREWRAACQSCTDNIRQELQGLHNELERLKSGS